MSWSLATSDRIVPSYQARLQQNIAIAACGDKCIMYASDYPLGDTKWPETVSRIRAVGFSETTQRRILGENAARLYKLGGPLG
jgi:predicted TIM-barrel fold metal-dependent hydrolase